MTGQNVLEHVLPLIFRLHVSVSKRNFVRLLDAFAFSLVQNWKSGKSENPNLVASNIVLAKTHKNECSIAVSFNIGLENEGEAIAI